MNNQPAPLFDPEHGPVTGADFVEIYADDRLLDDVGSGRHHKRSDPLADMLARMRAAAGDEPYPPLVDSDTAQEILATARHRYQAQGRRQWWLLLVVFLFAVAGVGLLLWIG